jgi:UV DNA damage repair endonuclease
LDGPLPKLCPVIPTSNQDGCEAKNRKKYVKLSSAVAAILVGVLKCQTQFWKRTTQESFQQSLVEIGSLVSEEKIFFKFHPPFF